MFMVLLQNDMEIILQKAMSVHAAHQRLMVMASTLLQAIAESKTSANARAYKDSEAEKAKQRKATFAEAVAAELAHKSRLHAAASGHATANSHHLQQRHSSSSSLSVSKELEQRGKGVLLDPATQEDREDACNLAERGRVPSRSGSRLRRALAADVRPPVLSANYHLEFAKKSATLETLPTGHTTVQQPPLSAAKPNTMKKSTISGLEPAVIGHLRPMSSPARSSAPALHLRSDSLAIAAYAGAPLFVEPSPLSKRMTNRGISSANGWRRRLNFKKRPSQRIPTSLAPASGGQDGEDTGESRDTHMADPVSHKHDDDQNGGRESESHAPTTSRSTASDAYEDETYEDDFADDSEPSTSRLADAQRLESDAELIDLLHELRFQDPQSGEVSNTSGDGMNSNLQTQGAVLGKEETAEERKLAAATCIQRHVRGHATRKAKATVQVKASQVNRSKRAAEKCRDNKMRRTKSHCDTLATSSSDRKIDRHELPTQRMQGFTDHGVTRLKPRRLLAQLHHEALAARAGAVAKSSNTPQKQTMKRREQIKKPSSAPSAMSTSLSAASSSQALTEASKDQQGETTTPDALKRIQALYSQGLAHHKEDHVELAIASYEAALQIPAAGREFASLHINLGSALMTQLKFAEALASFERAERIHPTNAKAAYNCALALMHLKRTSQAEERLRKALVLDPSHAKALHALSQLGNSSDQILEHT